jgi:hypothetical protein
MYSALNIPELKEKIIKSECNKQFDIDRDEPVDVNTALKIFGQYTNQGKYGLEIWSSYILVRELKGTDSTLQLSLQDNHYYILEIKQYQSCTKCGRKYLNKHT